MNFTYTHDNRFFPNLSIWAGSPIRILSFIPKTSKRLMKILILIPNLFQLYALLQWNSWKRSILGVLLVWPLGPKLSQNLLISFPTPILDLNLVIWKWLEHFQTFWTSNPVFVGTSTKYDVNTFSTTFGLELPIKMSIKWKKENFKAQMKLLGSHKQIKIISELPRI